MKLFINESKFKKIMLQEIISEFNNVDGNADNNPYAKKIKYQKSLITQLVDNYGSVMSSIENGRDYVVYELYSLSELLGYRYVLCRIIQDGEPYGTVAIKPLSMFRIKNY